MIIGKKQINGRFLSKKVFSLNANVDRAHQYSAVFLMFSGLLELVCSEFASIFAIENDGKNYFTQKWKRGPAFRPIGMH